MPGPARYLIGVSVLALATAGLAQTPAKAPTPAELDKLAWAVLRAVHNRGAELYNRGDAAGCHRMYEGALVTVRPFLAHRPTVFPRPPQTAVRFQQPTDDDGGRARCCGRA